MEYNEENSMIPVLSSIKIGRNEYDIKNGDYILYNGAVYQFCTGDNRVIKRDRYSTYSSIRLSNTALKKIPLNKMKKETYKHYSMDMIRWYF